MQILVLDRIQIKEIHVKFTYLMSGIYGLTCTEMFPFTVSFRFVVHMPDTFLTLSCLEMHQSKCDYSTSLVVLIISGVWY